MVRRPRAIDLASIHRTYTVGGRRRDQTPAVPEPRLLEPVDSLHALKPSDATVHDAFVYPPWNEPSTVPPLSKPLPPLPPPLPTRTRKGRPR